MFAPTWRHLQSRRTELTGSGRVTAAPGGNGGAPAPAVYVDDPDFTLLVGDALQTLRTLPDESVHCCVTSPPYWGLRDYGTGTWEGGDAKCDHRHRDSVRDTTSTIKRHRQQRVVRANSYRDVCGKCGATRVDQQLGLEPTPDQYVTSMVNVFREVRRVLRADGTLWLNIGDSYNNRSVGRKSSHQGGLGFESEDLSKSWAELTTEGRTRLSIENGDMKEKDLVGIPWMLAFALRADGWYLRSDIIWSKPNPMPESVTDRPTKAHEYLFLLTKSPRYFYDADAVRESYQDGPGLTGGAYAPPGQAPHGNARGPDGRRQTTVQGANGSIQHRDGERWPNGGRNKRSVWEIATAPYPDAHFATFPPALVEPCVKAGTSEHGCCPECGAPWEREVERETMVVRPAPKRASWQESGDDHARTAVGGTVERPASVTTTGWRPTCEHRALGSEPPMAETAIPCVVLDPFMGSGTTAQVARRLGRSSIGIELNPEYAELCARRLQQQSLFA